MEKMRWARYTLEYKPEALRLIGASRNIAAVAETLGLADQTLHNWIKAQRERRLGGPGSKPVSLEQMELARLRAELAKTKMELAIIKKAAFFKISRSSLVRGRGRLNCCLILYHRRSARNMSCSRIKFSTASSSTFAFSAISRLLSGVKISLWLLANSNGSMVSNILMLVLIFLTISLSPCRRLCSDVPPVSSNMRSW